MRRKWMVFSILCVCLLSAFILHAFAVESKEVNSNLKHEHIGDVFLGSSISILDPTNMKEKVTEDQKVGKSFDYYNVTISVNNINDIVYVATGNHTVKTKEGIKVGDPKKNILARYGQNYHTTKYEEKLYISYQDKQSEIRFWLNEDETIYFIELLKL